ncbi:protein FAM184A [Cyclospora cayetanensis]|uniref:Protein FAM184A n=1 Tax=Cyclospora cayetanensis TaxID=88456 RepID=A0A6P6RYB8_9EIME|nr:protein FAM184A [Cyclospora cayetanensis]
MESPEMRISINRKIAQLTRVIQRLSTTQEDHELHLQRLTDAYEQEIEEIILEANAKLSACGRAAREAHISKVTDAVGPWPDNYEVTELKQKLLAASAAAACELTKYKAALDAETLKKQEQWDKQLSKVQSKASALFVEHLPPKGRQSLLPLTALLLVAVVPSLMAALFSLLAFLHPFDFLCSFLASGEWRCWQSSLATASDALRKASEEFEASREALQIQIQELSTENDTLNKEVNLAKQIHKTPDVAKGGEKYTSQSEGNKSAQYMGCSLCLMRGSRIEGEKHTSYLSVARRYCCSLSQEIKRATSEAVELRHRLAEVIAQREAAEAEAAAAVNLSETQQRTSGQQHQKLEAELQRVQRLRHEEQQGHEKAVTLLERECARRGSDLLLFCINACSGGARGLGARAAKPQEAREGAAGDFRDSTQAKEQEVAVDLLSERELRVAAARSYDQMISAMEQDGLEKEAKLQQLVERCKELEGLLEETALQSTERLKEKGDACQQQLERQKQELHDAYLANRRLHEKVRMADDRVEEVALSARTEAAERAVQTAESLRIGLSLETAMQLKEQLADSERKRSETSIALEKLERDAQERATHEQKNCEHLKWELENTQKQLLQLTVAELRARLVAEETANKQEAVRYQEELQKQRDALNAEQEQALAAAASLAAAERASLQQGFQEAMKQAEQQMETQKQALKAELMARHSAQLQAVTCSHRAKQEEEAKEHHKEMQDLETRLRESAAAAAAAAAARLKAATDQTASMKELLQTTNQQLEATTEERKSLERTLECLRASQHEAIAALKAERVKHEEEMKAKEEEAQQRERAVELLMKLNQETLEREHASALADQEKEHQAEKSLLQSRMSTIEKEMEEQQRHLDRRPSRQEDLETIDALTKALKDANVRGSSFLLGGSKLEYRAYGSELFRVAQRLVPAAFDVLSDRTYNKVFGSDPKAGLVNPLERPNIQSRARRSTGSFMASSQTGQPYRAYKTIRCSNIQHT